MIKKIVIVGGTSAIAEYCARSWVSESSVELVLLGRDRVKTDLVAQDLRVRNPQAVISVEAIDFLDPVRVGEWVSTVFFKGNPDIVLIAHGTLPDQKACQKELVMTQEAMLVNGLSPVLFAEAFAGHMQQANHGTLAIIGSVAGDRGRKSNYVYGAAKGLVSRYTQGLQHRLAATAVKVILIKPGPTNTPMTAGLKDIGVKLADVAVVSKAIVDGIRKGTPTVYAPAKWALIMMVIRHLPKSVFNKMDI